MKKISFILALILAAAVGWYLQGFLPIKIGKITISGYNPSQKQTEQIIRNYLLSHPEILFEMDKKLQEKEEQDQKGQLEKIKANVIQNKAQIFDISLAGCAILGNPNGSIVIAEFTQHQCPACKKSAEIIDKLIKENSDLKLMMIFWPFFGEDAIGSAGAVIAAQTQQKADELNRLIFQHPSLVDKVELDKIIKSVPNLDTSLLAQEMKNELINKAIADNFKLAKELGISGTPFFVIANADLSKITIVPGYTQNFENDLRAAIDEVK